MTQAGFPAPSLLHLKSSTTFLTELSFKSIVLIMPFPAPKSLAAFFVSQLKFRVFTWYSGPYITRLHSLSLSSVLSPSTLLQALDILHYLLISKHAPLSYLWAFALDVASVRNAFFYSSPDEILLFSQCTNQKFPSLWRPMTTTIHIICVFFVFWEHYHAMSTSLIVLY